MILPLVLLSILPISDTTTTESLDIDEVVVVSKGTRGAKRSIKGQLANIDEHLAELSSVNLVRRGSYAWEPVVNNMQSERLSTTIDGMKIFYACTDKMDPVTSYVESGNLQSISLNSGLQGNPQSTGNIGGSLDLKLRKAGFDNDAFVGNASAGHEFNGNLQVYGADAAISQHSFYSNFGIFFRKAGNYKSGGNNEVLYSQFQKANAFANLGVRLTELDVIEGTIIFDRATNVGYPALNMDVAKAQGLITSVSHKHTFNFEENEKLSDATASWETKAYYNHIVHIMDDTHRPNVEIHMDMPGDSWTTGLYSLLRTYVGNHSASLNYDFYYNRVFADMTMYPGGAAPMYMVTWPDVGTFNTGIALSDNIALPHNQSVSISTKLSWQTQSLNNDEGCHALKVFFPNMTNSYNQTTGRVAASYAWRPSHWSVALGAGWGSRAATVTEAYGYYLNNTFDQYDYIGNPHLKNESAFELNGSAGWTKNGLKLSWEANAFLFSNYIIGQFETRLSPMTVDAEGVKVYGNLPNARIVNTSLSLQYDLLKWLTLNGKASYALGQDNTGDNLPLISPWAYNSIIDFHLKSWAAQLTVRGNARQKDFGEKYGETETPAYTIVNINAQYNFLLKSSSLSVRTGVENLLDKDYSTYSDWNKIPQKGRNIYVNLTYSFN